MIELRPRSEGALGGRVAVITGAASGIGRAVALRCAAQGAMAACLDRDRAAVELVVHEVAASGGSAVALGVDVRSRSEVHDSVTEVASRFGHVDVMANIAGISSVDAVVDATEEDVEEMIRVTVMGVYFGCQAAARVMVAQRSGSIINMSSTAIDVPTRGLGIYSACKAAVAMLSKVLAVEVGEYGVRVNAVAPGFVPTPMTTSHAWHERTVEEMKARSALQDIPTPDDVADLFLHLASDSSRMITGQTLRVNAGASMPW